MRELQAAFIQCRAVREAWTVYVQELCGQDADPEIRALFDEIGRDLVSRMSDAAIKEMAALLAQADGLADRDRKQLYFIVEGGEKR